MVRRPHFGEISFPGQMAPQPVADDRKGALPARIGLQLVGSNRSNPASALNRGQKKSPKRLHIGWVLTPIWLGHFMPENSCVGLHNFRGVVKMKVCRTILTSVPDIRAPRPIAIHRGMLNRRVFTSAPDFVPLMP